MENPLEQTIKVPRFKEANGFTTTKARSKAMAKIRGKNTKSEILLRKALWGLGIRYRKNDPRLPGKPDIVIQKYRLVIFIDGEFWHGYNWEKKKPTIKSNPEFWIAKIERNMQRDRLNNQLLLEKGWYVLRFWDQEIKKEFGVSLRIILDFITQSQLLADFE
jgi:DNA mismatch endonuclease (patch repair protein)